MDYLIPANTKKGQLIFGMFRPVDLILFGSGILITLVLLLTIEMSSTLVTIIILLPALVTGFLVVPVPYYHNMLIIILELIEFFRNQRRYEWKGWCVSLGIKKQKLKKIK